MSKFIKLVKEEKVFKYSVLERKLNIPLGLISKHIKGVQKLSNEHLKSLDDYLQNSIIINGIIIK